MAVASPANRRGASAVSGCLAGGGLSLWCWGCDGARDMGKQGPVRCCGEPVHARCAGRGRAEWWPVGASERQQRVAMALGGQDQVGVQDREHLARYAGCLPPQRDRHSAATVGRLQEERPDQLGELLRAAGRLGAQGRCEPFRIRSLASAAQATPADQVAQLSGGHIEPGRDADLIGGEHAPSVPAGGVCRSEPEVTAGTWQRSAKIGTSHPVGDAPGARKGPRWRSLPCWQAGRGLPAAAPAGPGQIRVRHALPWGGQRVMSLRAAGRYGIG